ncbi:MAG: hypothetical protein H6883_07405 [Rhodobiaceae bacterium]|nr:hypothetical protein [Rhodobiaceae bacterium]MCC0055947.1 hypothetical protein [Rhodobiaceae bacterium]
MALGFAFYYAYALAVGITAAGLAVSSYGLLTQKRASFRQQPETVGQAFGLLAVLVVGGPFIIWRNLMDARRVEQRPMVFVIAGSSIAAFWSFCAGVTFVSIATQLG